MRERPYIRVLDYLGRQGLPKPQISFCLGPKNEAQVRAPSSLFPRVQNQKTELISNAQIDSDSLVLTLNENTLVKDALLAPLVGPRETTKRKILVEFSSPNIAKPFHMGHFRSTIIGNFAANMYKTTDDVVKLNYLGDWGTQIGFIKVGLDLLELSELELTAEPVKQLYRAYVRGYSEPGALEKAQSIFSLLEKNENSEMSKFWEKLKVSTVADLKNTYEMLGIGFDEYSSESKYRTSNIQGVIQHLIEKGIARKNEESLLVTEVNGESVPLLKSDGSSLYLSRDVASALDRFQAHGSDLLVYVVDKSQTQHIENLKSILSRLGFDEKIEHLPFGRVTGMSTRKGSSIFLSDILEEATKRMGEQQLKSKNTRASDLETTRVLGISTLIVFFLKHRRTRDFTFNWDLALTSTGDSGVKFQYTHSRLKKLEETFSYGTPNLDVLHLNEPQVLQLIVELSKFEQVVESTRSSMESYILVSYLFSLCNQVSRCLKTLPIKGQAAEVAEQRALLFRRARETLSKGMTLLGILPLDKM